MKRAGIPKARSLGEETFALHCQAEKLTPVREFIFHPVRKWRFDYAFLDQKIAVEIEGLSIRFSRHSTFKGFREDCAKYNAAAKLGWRVLRYSTEMVTRGDAIADVLEMLEKHL